MSKISTGRRPNPRYGTLAFSFVLGLVLAMAVDNVQPACQANAGSVYDLQAELPAVHTAADNLSSTNVKMPIASH